MFSISSFLPFDIPQTTIEPDFLSLLTRRYGKKSGDWLPFGAERFGKKSGTWSQEEPRFVRFVRSFVRSLTDRNKVKPLLDLLLRR